MEVTRVDYVRVPVDDIEAAQRFYGEILGLRRNEHLDHEDWVEYETGNLTLALVDPQMFGSEFSPLVALAIRVAGEIRASARTVRAPTPGVSSNSGKSAGPRSAAAARLPCRRRR